MSEYTDPDLETVAPLPPLPPAPGAKPTPPPPDREPFAAIIAALVVVSLVVGFGVATLVLNARDKNPDQVATAPFPTPSFTVPTIPGLSVPGSTTPATTTPAQVPTDPDESVLGGLILRQSEVPAADVVSLLDHGADLTVATLDLCNGTFASEARRTARRQVTLTDANGQFFMSTEAILYRAPANGTAAFSELKSVAAHCPAKPVASPAGEPTVTTKFAAAPDAKWPKTATVDRLAYDFVSTPTDPTQSVSHSIAVYLRRGRVLIGLYFGQPGGTQQLVAGRNTIAGIVALFEERLAQVPAKVAGG